MTAFWISCVETLIYILVPSYATTVAIGRYRGIRFSYTETFSMIGACSLFGMPILGIIIPIITPYHYLWIPFACLSLISLYFIIRYGSFKKKPSLSLGMLIGFVACISALIWVITHAYYPLPDYDPYTWIQRYQLFLQSYISGTFTIPLRPGFFATILLYNNLAHIDLNTVMKYGLPFLYVAVCFPVWMVASTFKSAWIRLGIISIPFWSASTVLYATTSMPQLLFIIAMFYAISFLLYARLQNKSFYYYIAGMILAASLCLYEVAFIPFIIWIVVTIIRNWKRLYAYTRSQFSPITFVLLALLLFTNRASFHQPAVFFQIWVQKIYRYAVAGYTNFLFPTSYINVDGNSVGWDGYFGVFEYYAYYVSAPVILVLLVSIILLFQKKWRVLFVQELREHNESQVALGIFLVFFTISEIFPRIINLALLPERAWIFGGISVAYGAILMLYTFQPRLKMWFALVIFFLTIPSIFAAWYVNNEKKFLIPQYQVSSAEWIRGHLPKNRVVISDGNENLLQYYSQSQSISVPSMYCDASYANPTTLIDSAVSISNSAHKNTIQNNLIQSLTSYITSTKHVTLQGIISISTPYIQKTDADKNSYYVYYAANDPKNPYLHRPYMKIRNLCQTFIFDQHPEHYERVYQDGSDVIIWKIR